MDEEIHSKARELDFFDGFLWRRISFSSDLISLIEFLEPQCQDLSSIWNHLHSITN